MQHQRKRGNPRRHKKVKRTCVETPKKEERTPAKVRLTLHTFDPITGCEDMLYTLFYEVYRGYTIYSTEQGRCCLHGRDGCLRIQGKYACFPDIEQAKNLIKHFQADGRTAQERMERYVPEDEYVCLNRWQGTRSRENMSTFALSRR